ncbi:unnamed protein product [Symbiodinium pilosum]|uniref:Uncharacterized protein n=1 Tax=Symbiodinium pilosum TaxID=2952 RepID=A0A812SJW7_SYMPI|nr:unnamed protein product [Symbiodinium pilosum]
MALTALIGLYAWYQDMNITYICLWGAASLFQGVMTCISSLLPAITGVLTFDIFNLILLISVPVVYFLAAAFAWHLYNDYAEDHGKKAYAFDPFGKYAAKYDPLEKVPISDSMLDWALGRADLDRCWNDGVYCFFLVGEGGRVTKGVMGFRGRPTTGNTERLAIDLEF